MTNAKALVGSHDILFITLDTLRYDVAETAWLQGWLPTLSNVLPANGWERRHSPGSFTFAAHQAFFAGFLPTPTTPGPHPRLFTARFDGSVTTTDRSFVYDEPTWVEGLQTMGYRTVCIGGVGFFNKQTQLTRVLPKIFQASYWTPEMGVTSRVSTEQQVALASRLLRDTPTQQRLLMFINVSAIHQPNCIFGDAHEDTPATQAEALRYVDGCLSALFATCRRRAPTFCIICSDHGTAYGEDGYQGHRLAHQSVWEVPYAEFFLSAHHRAHA